MEEEKEEGERWEENEGGKRQSSYVSTERYLRVGWTRMKEEEEEWEEYEVE